MNTSTLLRLPLILMLVFAVSGFALPPVFAQEASSAEEEKPEAPVLSEALLDPKSDIQEFNLRLIPLSSAELEALAGEWTTIVKKQTESVVTQQIRALSEDESVAKTAREQVVSLTENRNLMFSFYSAVVDNWEKKNGDPAKIESFRAWRNAILVEEKRNADFTTVAKSATEWVTDPDGGIKVGAKAATIIGSFIALIIGAGFVRGFARRMIRRIPNMSQLLTNFISKVIYWLTIAVGLMFVLSLLGIDITPIFALIGGASFIAAFALQDTLSNLASGLMIMINRPFDVDDYVDIGGVGGTVRSVSIVSTTIATPDNQVIIVPNSTVWGNIITNTSASPTRRVDMTFGIGYGDSIENAQRVLEDLVSAHPLILTDPEPVIRVSTLGASSVDFICRPWTRSEDYWTVLWDLQRQVKERFDAEGISIPFPQTEMHINVANPTDAAPLTGSAAQKSAPATESEGDYAAGDEGHNSPS